VQKAIAMTQEYSTAQTKALSTIVKLAHDHNLNARDIEKSLHSNTPSKVKRGQSSFALTLVSYMAGVLILSGLFIFISMMWPDLDGFTRVILSLGTGLLSYVVGLLLYKDDSTKKASVFLWVLSAILIPTGLFVLLKEFAQGNDVLLAGVFVFGSAMLLYLLSFLLYRTQSFLFLSLFYGFVFPGTLYEYLGINTQIIWLVTGVSFFVFAYKVRCSDYHAISFLPFLIANVAIASSAYYFLGNTEFESVLTALYIGMIAAGYIFKSRTFTVFSVLIFIALYCKQYSYSWSYFDKEFFSFVSVVTGLSMIFAAEWIKRYSTKTFLWHFFGSSILFTGLMSLLYLSPFDILFVIAPAFLIFAGSKLNSKALIFSSILALLSFIGYYSSTYFADAVGWPVALMISGVALGVLSIVGVKMSNKIKNSAV